MKIAVTYDNGTVYQHFGHTKQFKIYTVEDNKVVSSETVDTGDSGHGALAGFLAARDVSIVICGNMGAGAQNALTEAGIQFFGGVAGNTDDRVQEYLEGRLAAGTSTVITKKRGKSMMDLPLFHAESSGYRRQAAYPLM